MLVARRRAKLEALTKELGNARAVAMDLGQPGAAAALAADLAAHDERAIEQVPRTCGWLENSALRSGCLLPPIPVPVGSPPCAMKPGITR